MLPFLKQRKVSIRIYDITGKIVKTLADSNLDPGAYSFIWDNSGDVDGIYFAQVTSKNSSITKKLVLCK
jgi:flagellar hook assembly protein FlgD